MKLKNTKRIKLRIAPEDYLRVTRITQRLGEREALTLRWALRIGLDNLEAALSLHPH